MTNVGVIITSIVFQAVFKAQIGHAVYLSAILNIHVGSDNRHGSDNRNTSIYFIIILTRYSFMLNQLEWCIMYGSMKEKFLIFMYRTGSTEYRLEAELMAY